MKKLRIIWLAIWASVFLMASLPVYAASASMYLSPGSGSVGKGSVITVYIYENSGSEPVNAVQANLNYPSNLFDFVSISSSSAFGISAQSSGGGGSVHIGRGALPAVTGNQLVAGVSFRAKTDSGSASVSFASSSSVVSSRNNKNILTSKSGGTYSLGKAAVAPPSAKKDTTRPKINSVAATNIAINSAVIRWTTSEPATSEVLYGLNQGYGLTAGSGRMVTAHKVVLNSPLVSPGTTYHYLVKSVDPAGNSTTSADYTFHTKGATLIATVLNQKNDQPIKGAKIEINGRSATTDKDGKATLNDLPVGNLFGSITFKNKRTVASVQIKPVTAKASNIQMATFKIAVPSNLLWFIVIPLVLLLLLIAWWLGKEEGGGQNPLRAIKTGLFRWTPNGSAKKGAMNDPHTSATMPNNNPQPTVIHPAPPDDGSRD